MGLGCVTEKTSDRPRYDQMTSRNATAGLGEPPPTIATPARTANSPLQSSAAARGPTSAPAPIVPVTCQGSLDEICTALLLHHRVYNHMPEKLEDLKRFAEFGSSIGDLRCPISKQPYTYFPQGIRVADEELKREGQEPIRIATYVVVVDPVPAHGGLRYAIFIQRPEGATDIQARIGILPEGAFPR